MRADRRRLLWAAAAAAMGAGCASTSVPLADLPASPVLDWAGPAAAGLLIVARDTGMAGSALDVQVSVNGRVAAQLPPGQVLRLRLPAGPVSLLFVESFGARDMPASTELPPGSYVSRVQPTFPAQRRPTSLDVAVSAGQTTLVRLGYDDRAVFSAWRDAL